MNKLFTLIAAAGMLLPSYGQNCNCNTLLYPAYINTASGNAKLNVGGAGGGNVTIYGQSVGGYAVMGQSNMASAIFGNNTGTGGSFYGVWGNSASSSGSGVYGTNNGGGYAGYFTGKGYFSGNVGIGMMPTSSALVVNGRIAAKEVQVMATPADFVFAKDYTLRPLSEVEKYVQTNKHLPEIPSGKEVAKNGYKVGEMQSKLLQKVEELTLYVIQQQKEIDALKSKLGEK